MDDGIPAARTLGCRPAPGMDRGRRGRTGVAAAVSFAPGLASAGVHGNSAGQYGRGVSRLRLRGRGRLASNRCHRRPLDPYRTAVGSAAGCEVLVDADLGRGGGDIVPENAGGLWIPLAYPAPGAALR